MPIQGIKTFIVYVAALILGIVASIISLATSMRQEVPLIFQKPAPTPVLMEQTRELSEIERSTMSASFIKEFEMMMASEGGEKK